MNNTRRSALPLTLLCLFLALLLGIWFTTPVGAGAGDWVLPLGEQFQVERCNDTDISIRQTGTDHPAQVAATVTHLAVTDHWAAARQEPKAEETAEPRFWLLDLTEGRIYGPYAREGELAELWTQQSRLEELPWQTVAQWAREQDQ